MKLGPRVTKVLGRLAAAALRLAMRTLNYRVAYHDPTVDPGGPEYDGQRRIFVFWHEYMLLPLYLRGNCGVAALVSQHRDADIISQLLETFGFDVVRGSTTRGGMRALRELARQSRRTNLTISPDGPQGPRRTLSPGAIYLASRLGLPVVPVGMAFRRPWRLPSWDRFAVPRPFSRGRMIYGPPLIIPKGASREALEHHRSEVERMLNDLTEEAETWAETGDVRLAEYPLRRRPRRRAA